MPAHTPRPAHYPPAAPLTAEAILAHPDFPEARRVFIAEHRKVYDSEVFPGRFGADVGRVTTLAIIVCLYANYVRADRETWPTLTKLKTTVARFGFASPRLIDTFVARLVQTGDLVLRKQPDDSRVRLLCPTEKLLAWDREWMAAHYAALDLLYPEPGFPLARQRDAAFQTAHAKCAIDAFDGIIAMIWSNMDLVFFLSSTSALIILLSVLDRSGADAENHFQESDLGELAKSFSVSRSHIRNILAAAQEIGFLTRSGPRKTLWQLTPRLVSAFDRFIADSLVHSDVTYRLGLRGLAEAGAATVAA
ncbi:hypothetical protein DK427_15505 [Methylobacterium radiodurans]|uniref:Uncharacterized protein n=2 Tax=Methylobacterium radiodurans TaxID=2202828 RepID=A0A2U8W0M6_9HYPH|nr:hypothetical protein DK427_15505 [Methylobacterium radiodurans]